MCIVVGGKAHVGAAVAKTLLDEEEAVTVVTRSPEKAGTGPRSGHHVDGPRHGV